MAKRSAFHQRKQTRAGGRFRAAALAVSMACLVFSMAGLAQTALPTGFGSLALGMPWADVQSDNKVVELTRVTSEWEGLVYECGYRSAQIALGNGRLLVTAEDFVVTQLSYVTAIEKDSNLMQVAQLVIKTYGQPRQVSMRDALGAVTIDQSAANYVKLDFSAANLATFVISGEPLWEYRISIEDPNVRRVQNRTIRCAREKQLQKKSVKKTS
jgi:hypothetical protein